MPSLIYNPGIKVYIDTGERHGLIDVSNDVTDGTLVRRSDGVSTFQCTIQNQRRKYDSLFIPNDRIIVMMKRLVWVRVFSGYLNSVPLISAWPRPVAISASCTLKRLQYWYWDAYTQASLNLVIGGMTIANSDPKNTDGGITQVVNLVLQKVAFWPKQSIHVGRIPEDWYKLAAQIAGQVEGLASTAEEFAAQMQATTGANGITSGSSNGSTTGAYVNGALQDGAYGGTTISGDQCRNAEKIFEEGRARASAYGLDDHDIAIAIMTAFTESSLHNDNFGDRDSLGLFQQRYTWTQNGKYNRLDPKTAAMLFYSRLSHIPKAKRDSQPMWVTAQAIQKSAFSDGSNYRKYASLGLSVVNSIANAASGALTNPTTTANLIGQSPSVGGGTVGQATAAAIASVGLTLVNTYHVPYLKASSSHNLSNLIKTPPVTLDCSAFVEWCYLHTLGHMYNLPSTAHEQYAFCKKAGLTVTVQQALSIPGALVFVGSSEGSIEHVEMSLGDGRSTIGSHHSGTVASIGNSSPSYWNYGALLPRIDYAGAKGGQVVGGVHIGGAPGANVNQSPLAAGTSQYYQQFQSTSHDPIDVLFGQGPGSWIAIPSDSAAMAQSATLTGVLTLLNDQPLLPYIMALMNSTMRSFCSAPNGDFIAWFPDYYGLWGTAGKLVLEPIEVQDFTVYWNDDYFVTHQFTLAGIYNVLDLGSGGVSTDFGGTADNPTVQIYNTHGIASIDIPAMLTALFGIAPSDTHAFANFIYKQFGARPNFTQIDGLVGKKAEFFSAMFLFMRQWAYQYNADIPLTFMPEAFPGMLVQIPRFDFQAYITTVTHTFSFGEGGSFNTTLNIAAPARLPSTNPHDKSHVLLGLPTAGGYRPGLQKDPTLTEAEVNVLVQGSVEKQRAAAIAKKLTQRGP